MTEKRKNDRHDVNLLVKLQYPDALAFAERHAANISEGGMFIVTREPRGMGTTLVFEVQLANGQRVLRGEAAVRWIRMADDPGGPAGMGLQFLKLDQRSVALIRKIVDLRKAQLALASALEEPAEAHLDLKPYSGSVSGGEEAPSPSSPEETGSGWTTLEQPADGHQEPPADREEAGVDSAPEAPQPLEDPVDVGIQPPAPSMTAEGPGSTSDHPEAMDLGEDDVEEETDAGQAPAPVAEAEGVLEGTETLASPDPEQQALSDGLGDDVDLDIDFDDELDESGAYGHEASDEDEEIAVADDLLEQEPLGPTIVFLSPPDEVPDEGPVIGIDLGTTNSCVAIFADGKPKVIKSREGYNTVPSIVALTANGKLKVGHSAKGQMLTNPGRTVYGAKRLVGRQYDSPTVQMVSGRFHYPICSDSIGKAAVSLGEHVVTLEEIQGLILSECKSMAQAVLEQPVHRAVVTVPAYYSDSQRQAVRESGRLAGLKVERIVNEPTAAALAYGLNRELKKKILVYDLGGGTFDATAMHIDGNVFEVLATGGDTFLGGVDFDNQIVDWLLSRFEEMHGQPFEGDQVALSRVADAAERAKIELSQAVVHELHIPFLTVDSDGQPLDLQCTITREDIEALCFDLIDRSLDVVRDVLLDAGLKPTDVEDVILVGGQSRMPLVRHKIGKLFGREPHPGVHPDEAVGLGAALLAGSFNKTGDMVLIDVLPMTLGVGLPGGRFKRVIERNTPLPTHKTYGIATSRRNQKEIAISVFQGEDTHVSGNEYLGTLKLADLPKGPKGFARAAVTFGLGPECVLQVTARDLTTGKEVKTKLATRDTPEVLRKRLGIDQEAVTAAEAERRAELSYRGGRFWRALKSMVGAS